LPNIRWLLALITGVHRFLYRVSGGRLGSRLGRSDMLLLTTRGRKSGRERTVPLLYVADGERFVVVASNAGDERAPAWWLNLQASPAARVQVGRDTHAVGARRAGTEEAERLWPRLEASYPSYAAYRARTRREIPVVLLERREPRSDLERKVSGAAASAGPGSPSAPS
jgi:deazaflavin-dependent oxidoreductase (nitroreductase family)